MSQVVRAAGGVVLRAGPEGPEVLFVHRPRYGDWSLPKGKRDPAETDEQCAVREVWEESGIVGRLAQELLPNRYVDRKGRDKVVRWWVMDVVRDEGFDAGDEVDERRWVPVGEVAGLASYGADRERVAASVALRFT